MDITAKLEAELNKVLSGQPWYGTPVYDILGKVTFETAYEKPGAHAHNIAEILLHMISWTEEVMDRMNEQPAGTPTSGDWPDTGLPDEEKWQNYVSDLKLVNVNLIKAIRDFPAANWGQPIIDERDNEPVTTYEELVCGFIQHQVYHAGQIAILNKIING